MSHPSPWRCLSCGSVIGEHDAAGRLRPIPPAATLSVRELAANGAALLDCSQCGEVRLRKPGRSPVAQLGQ